MLPYDATAVSLFTPYKNTNIYLTPRDTVTSGACVELSRLIYILFEKSAIEKTRLTNALQQGGYDLIDVFDIQGTQAMAVSHMQSNECVVIFRGSEIKWHDIKTDLTVIPEHGNMVDVYIKALRMSSIEFGE